MTLYRKPHPILDRQRPPGRRPRSGGRVLDGPGGRSLAGARRPAIAALFACRLAGGAGNGQPCGLALSRFERFRWRLHCGGCWAPFVPSPRSAQSGKPHPILNRQQPPGRRPRSSGRVLDGPGGRSLAGARRPAIAALFACRLAGGAMNRRGQSPPEPPCTQDAPTVQNPPPTSAYSLTTSNLRR